MLEINYGTCAVVSVLAGKRTLNGHLGLPASRCPSLLRNKRIHSSKGTCRRGHRSTKAQCQRTEGQAKAHRSANRRPLEGRRILPPSQGVCRPGKPCG